MRFDTPEPAVTNSVTNSVTNASSRSPVDHARHVHVPTRTKPPLNPAMGLLLDHGSAMLLALALILLGSGWFGLQYNKSEVLVACGALGMLVILAIAPVTWHLRRRQATHAQLSKKIDGLADAIRHLSDSSALSDDARRVLNRSTERELLCRAIEEDIQKQAWDAALVLCNELAERFGYRADAEEFRGRIDLARAEIQERRVADAIARLDGLIVQRRWDVAVREAQRIRRLYPDSTRVERLRERVEQARAVYKTDLERRFLEASATGNRVDEAMLLLKEMDSYFSESEAEPFREVARGVIGKARDNLGAQFKIAVQDRQWPLAASLGRRIINEFPNTRMAQEVRGMLDGILQRANTGGAGGTGASAGEALASRN